MPVVHLIDCVAGNIRSLVNAIEKLGWKVAWIKDPSDIGKAERIIFPGVGHFGHCMTQCGRRGYVEPIKQYIADGKPFMGICVGLQALFTASDEDPSTPGMDVIEGRLQRFSSKEKSVPHIGWNSATADMWDDADQTPQAQTQSVYGLRDESRYYFVHSFMVPYLAGKLEQQGWTVAKTVYGTEEFVGAVARENVFATQFHPEKSGIAGLRVLKAFLEGNSLRLITSQRDLRVDRGLTRRVIACLDVRANDAGDLVVTKGDQYDVRAKDEKGQPVRNLGKPVAMAQKYYDQGADEITFLNITSFRNSPLADLPMLDVLRQTSETVFVPLTIGGGIRDSVDIDGTKFDALEIAKMYFQSGADKVSIGSDAVTAAEEYHASGQRLSGRTAIETISKSYGNQAVVVSIDPRRKYVARPEDTSHRTIKTGHRGPKGEEFCWYQCTIKGGREDRDIDVHQLATAVEAMGAGELLLNCIDRDGSNKGFDLELINTVKNEVRIPVIASSGAGTPQHFEKVFEETRTDAALGAGMFHRGDWTVKQVKDYLCSVGLKVRSSEVDDWGD